MNNYHHHHQYTEAFNKNNSTWDICKYLILYSCTSLAWFILTCQHDSKGLFAAVYTHLVPWFQEPVWSGLYWPTTLALSTTVWVVYIVLLPWFPAPVRSGLHWSVSMTLSTSLEWFTLTYYLDQFEWYILSCHCDSQHQFEVVYTDRPPWLLAPVLGSLYWPGSMIPSTSLGYAILLQPALLWQML